MSIVRVALVQQRCGVDVSANIDRTSEFVIRAAEAGAQVICLQELYSSQYPCQREDHDQFQLAEPIDGPSVSRLQKVARQQQCVIVAPFFERRAAGVFHNSAAIIDADGSIAGLYRKMHIPDDPLYYEKFYFAPGDLGFLSFQTRYAKIGVCICWDQWFPEAARLTAMSGAELLFYPTAIGWIPGEKTQYGDSQYSAWQTMMRSHAIANGLFVAAPNRVGIEGELEFWGGSFAADPYGNVLKQASHNDEDTMHVECDLAAIETARVHWPFFRDRRIDSFDGLTRRWSTNEVDELS